MATVSLRARHTAFPALLARYVRGEIGESVWNPLMHLMDEADVSSTERMAYARFVNDVVREGGPGALFVPKEDEARDLLVDTRLAQHTR